MADHQQCSKCGAGLSEGFIVDHGHFQTPGRQTWIEGAPESSFWSGLKTSGRNVFVVRALRCAGCGFLEFYADQKPDAKSGFSELFGG